MSHYYHKVSERLARFVSLLQIGSAAAAVHQASRVLRHRQDPGRAVGVGPQRARAAHAAARAVGRLLDGVCAARRARRLRQPRRL